MSQADYQALADSTATAHGVPPALFSALITKENASWNPYAIGVTGDMGLAQLNPNTYPSLGVGNPLDPQQNLSGAATYLQQLHDKFGNWFDALRGYNAGPSAATANPNISAAYANTILQNAGMANMSQDQSADPNAPKSTLFNVGPFLSDPVGYFKSSVANGVTVIIVILIIGALLWFGFQQVIKE